MQLQVLSEEPQSKPWYADGLQFTCTQCGNCCTGAPGFVWLSDDEVARLALYLELPIEEALTRYCRKVGGRYSLKELRSPAGLYDCIFLKERKQPDAQGVLHTQRACGIYAVRPLQCRTWPFWDSNLADPANWNTATVRCHGMNTGRRFSREEMEALRDAPDWPENPPTSK